MYIAVLAIFIILPLIQAVPSFKRQGAPTVTLSSGAIVIGARSSGVDSFVGIPFAQPPIGSLRLKPPRPYNGSSRIVQATGTPTTCPQFFLQANTGNPENDGNATLFASPSTQQSLHNGEDCLNLSVRRPSTATVGSRLPVVYWLYPGAFEFGSAEDQNAATLIATSVAQGKGFIFVSANYRSGGFGFLPGKEILADGSSNLGLLDQRLGLKWVADNIASFGGDPLKVTLWGYSSGAISVFSQMALYDGNHLYRGAPLFRAAIMQSGSIAPTDPIDYPKGQAIYNTVIKEAGCLNASDTLECLRAVPYEKFLNAANSVPNMLGLNSVALSYLPRPDGISLISSPEVSLKAGKITQIPYIIGDQEDEGTLFALAQKHINTTADLENYLSTIFFHGASPEQISGLVASYPDDPTAGSPFRTGYENNIYPQFKRLAALLGDVTFTLTRRILLSQSAVNSPTLPTYSYISSCTYGTSVIGTSHTSGTPQIFGTTQDPASIAIRAYLISFVNNMNPNSAVGQALWPTWAQGNILLNFNLISKVGSSYVADTFRNTSFTIIAENQSSFRI